MITLIDDALFELQKNRTISRARTAEAASDAPAVSVLSDLQTKKMRITAPRPTKHKQEEVR